MTLRSVLLLSAFAVAGAANAADVLTSYSFENLTLGTPTPSSTGRTYSVASTGGLFTGTATGNHASANTVYTGPAGNGSAKAFSSNNWAVGDYYQFTTSTFGYEGLTFSFDQAGSGTGPNNFNVAYSVDGTTFTTLPGSAYTVGATSFNAGTAVTTNTHTFNLSSVAALNDLSTVYLRVVDASTGSINGGTVGTGGTSRVDNVVISGTAQAVPEPSAFAALGLGAVAILRRRRSAK